ncbi:hypothetical protein ACQPW1_14445 [Nocardia sp. CA-128927]|uniref:hypothetical protein n=1 Tax=Nocardia sp. CA-128927 TaxID=3239975 RepID=UPI003D98131F
MILIVVPLWIIAAVAIISFSRFDRGTQTPPSDSPRLSPEALLTERFASGDVDETEYLHRLAVLRPTAEKPVDAHH